jgi:hypothetical protein
MDEQKTDIDGYGDGETGGDYPNVTEGNMEEDEGETEEGEDEEGEGDE